MRLNKPNELFFDKTKDVIIKDIYVRQYKSKYPYRDNVINSVFNLKKTKIVNSKFLMPAKYSINFILQDENGDETHYFAMYVNDTSMINYNHTEHTATLHSGLTSFINKFTISDKFANVLQPIIKDINKEDLTLKPHKIVKLMKPLIGCKFSTDGYKFNYISNKNKLIKLPKLNNKLFVYDIETYYDSEDFFYKGKFVDVDFNKGEILNISDFVYNDIHTHESFMKYIVDNNITLCAFNNHNYDDKMLACVLLKQDPYKSSKDIIDGDYNSVAYNCSIIHNTIDLIKDIKGSLKYYEAMFGMDIKESGVGFDVKRKLTEEERLTEIKYNEHDVDAAIRLLRYRLKGGAISINNKLLLINNYDLPLEYLKQQDTVVTEAVLQGDPVDWHTAYDNLFNLDIIKKNSHIFKEIDPKILQYYEDKWHAYKAYIPGVINKHEYKKKFTTEHFPGIYHYETKQFITKKDDLYKFRNASDVILNVSVGGNHSDNMFFIYEGNIYHLDFKSYYPNIMVHFLLEMINTENPDIYKELLEKRVELTELVKEELDNILKGEYESFISGVKLLLNKAYGVMGSAFSSMFNPEKMTTVCVMGQLLINELIFRLDKKLATFSLVQSNTDGVYVMISLEEYNIMKTIVLEYSKEINIGIDIDEYSKIIQSSVNEYIKIDKNGKISTKGSMLKNHDATDNFEPGSSTSNSLSIKAHAIYNYFIHNMSAEETVKNCKDVIKYQKIIKTSQRRPIIYDKINNVTVQKVNRLFATKSDKFLKSDLRNINIDDLEKCYGKNKDYKELINNEFFDEYNGSVVDTFDGASYTIFNNSVDDFKYEDLDLNFYIELCNVAIETFKGN